MAAAEHPHRSLPTLVLDLSDRVTRVETQNDWILQGQRDAQESRREIHHKLDAFNRIADTVARIEPLVIAHEALRLRGAGAHDLGKWLARALWAVIGSAIAIGVELVHYLTSSGRH